MVIGDTSLMVVMPQQAPIKAVAGYNVTNQTLDVFLRTNAPTATACPQPPSCSLPQNTLLLHKQAIFQSQITP